MSTQSLKQSLGLTLSSEIQKSRVLLVGAGGIGCELLKNLALSGFQHIELVDLDTIDLSNLNRQFLFRNEHIKKSKALVAKEVAQTFNPRVHITAHHANIKDSQFSVPWFRSFTLVFNALDNLDARRYVNRMCLAAGVPLIESGTTGFNGQTQVIRKGVTACYECTPKPVPKSFPVCTIRSTPSQAIHCIVWAKSYLLTEIFGTSEDEAVFDHTEDADNAEEIEELKREAAALRDIRNAVGSEGFAKALFEKVFHTDIDRLRSMEDMWKSRAPPTSLDFEEVRGRAQEAIQKTASLLANDQRTWSLEENLAVFLDSVERLKQRVLRAKEASSEAEDGVISFDKDDIDTLDFVSASANIRSFIFGIEGHSRFSIKQMAGNIIPAIATTNAIVAGLCVLQAFKVLRGEYEAVREVFLSPFASNQLLASGRATPPDPGCPVCSAYYVTLWTDLARATLGDVEQFVRETLGLGADREFALSSEAGLLYDPDEDGNLPERLADLGLGAGTSLIVMDEEDVDTLANVVLSIQPAPEGQTSPVVMTESVDFASLPRKFIKPAAAAAETSTDSTYENTAETKDDGAADVSLSVAGTRIFDLDGEEGGGGGGGGDADGGDDDAPSRKRSRSPGGEMISMVTKRVKSDASLAASAEEDALHHRDGAAGTTTSGETVVTVPSPSSPPSSSAPVSADDDKINNGVTTISLD